jgi:hypothetical protein
MSETIIGQKTEASAFFCPQCSSPDVERRSLLVEGYDGDATCHSCKWTGKVSQLAKTNFKHGFKSDEEIAHAMMIDIRNLLAKTSAKAYGSFLIKWGFLDSFSAAQLGRYMMDIATATSKAIIETRKALAEEKARERTRQG